MADPYWIADGIPHRIGATRCVLGTLRSSPDSVEAQETTTEYDNVTGCSPRNPEHGVKFTDDGLGNNTFTAMSPYSTYPTKLPLSTENPDTHLVIKARGELERDDDGTWLFPKIKLTLRPLFTRLDYKWVADAVATSNIDSVTEFGGGYEEDINGESVWDDFDFFYQYNAPTLTKPEGGSEAASDEYIVERDRLENAFVERGIPLYLQGDFYYRAEDRPPNLSSDYSPPLKPWEIDLTLYPRADGEEAYQFKKNESWDLRYRYPSWYPQYGGSPFHIRDAVDPWGKWVFYTQSQILPSDNPFAYGQSQYAKGIPQLLCPVEKYIRIQEGSKPLFPIKTPQYAGQATYSSFPEMYLLHQPKHLQVVSKVRKRYPYSFTTQVQSVNYPYPFYVYDNNPDNVFYGIDIEGLGFAYTLWGTQYYFATRNWLAGESDPEPVKYDCKSWWRMEIETDRCEWNFNEKLDEGWTIKGYVKFGKKLLEVPQAYQGGALRGSAPFFYFTGGQVVSPVNGVFPLPAFGFENWQSPELDVDAGQTPFTIKITRDNALGTPVTVVDFPIGGQTFVPNGEGGYDPVQWGDAPERSINFITDFVITEIIPPTPPD